MFFSFLPNYYFHRFLVGTLFHLLYLAFARFGAHPVQKSYAHYTTFFHGDNHLYFTPIELY